MFNKHPSSRSPESAVSTREMKPLKNGRLFEAQGDRTTAALAYWSSALGAQELGDSVTAYLSVKNALRLGYGDENPDVVPLMQSVLGESVAAIRSDAASLHQLGDELYTLRPPGSVCTVRGELMEFVPEQDPVSTRRAVILIARENY